MASEDPKMSKQGSAGKRKHGTLIPQKLETFSRLELGESCIVIMVTYNTGSSAVYGIKKQLDQLQPFTASAVKDLGHYRYCLIICHLCNPTGSRSREFGCIHLWNPNRL